MKLRTITSIFIILQAFTCILHAQTPDEVRSFSKLFKPAESKPDHSLKVDPANEFRLILTGGFVFYKTFISSQDGAKCTFYPSCSVYALNTIQTNGLIGVLDAIDRLTRCNGISPEKYQIHEPSQRYYDPVEKIRH
ncbi:MAG: membrane protein insertion efficiency factor YidD [Bacteroidia bacterium]|nr:membrane protein insertion efficiency factor YidD [Bacteroidia bacterium]